MWQDQDSNSRDFSLLFLRLCSFAFCRNFALSRVYEELHNRQLIRLKPIREVMDIAETTHEGFKTKILGWRQPLDRPIVDIQPTRRQTVDCRKNCWVERKCERKLQTHERINSKPQNYFRFIILFSFSCCHERRIEERAENAHGVTDDVEPMRWNKNENENKNQSGNLHSPSALQKILRRYDWSSWIGDRTALKCW